MNKIALLLPALLLFGCLAQPPTQMANPASEFCVARGGTLEIVSAEDGSQSGVCTLATGEKCDEWAYYNGACPAPSPSPEPVMCGSHSLGESWNDGCNDCTCTENGAACTLKYCATPSPSVEAGPVVPSDSFDKLEYYYELALEEYFGAEVSMAKEVFYYNNRWSGSHLAAPTDPEDYQFEVRVKKDYRSEYGKERLSNGYRVTWDLRGSGDEIHWFEFKCGAYQLWMKTAMVNQTVFHEAMDAVTGACVDYQAN